MQSRCLLLALLVVAARAVPPSRFVKPIDIKEVEKAWEDPESDDWHEDSFEWKRAHKKQEPVDVEELQRKMKAGVNVKESILERDAKSKDMQMAFATLKAGTVATKEEAEKMGVRWRDMLLTDAIKVAVYAISENELLFTEEEGRILDVRNFVLAQPEIEKFRWKDTDFLPKDLPQYLGASAAAPAKSSKRKRSSKKTEL